MAQNLSDTLIRILYRLQKLFGIKPRGLYFLSGCPRSGTSAMRKWLQEQPKVAAMFEPRILISAHRFANEVERFSCLHNNRQLLLPLIRQLVFSYCASTKFVWQKRLIIKEPLEAIAFPDRRYSDFLQNMRAVFPELKIIFMVRNPLSTIWSMRQRKWGYSLTVENLREYTLMECIQNWCDCAELAYQNAGDSSVYICMFERLISEPEEESRRIFDFLSINSNNYFQPKPTKKPGFSTDDTELILRETEPFRKSLSTINQL
jgi:hypothetical protein